jgi:putative membrane protein
MLADTQPTLDWQVLAHQIFLMVVFTVIGLGFFALSDWMIERVMPRSLRKQLEEDKNVAVAIVIAAVIIGVAMIVSAAIH